MVLDLKKWERLAKLLKQEHERGPVPLLLKKIIEHGNLRACAQITRALLIATG